MNLGIAKSVFITLLFCLIYLINNGTAIADVGDWKTYTNMSDIRDVAITGDLLWCVTNGGVFKYDINKKTFELFTNTEGLVSNNVQCLEIDPDGNIWFGMVNGHIQNLNSQTMTWTIIDDYAGHPIYDLEFYGDSLFVALDIGVSLYDIRRQEVKETYKNLGPTFPVKIPVNDIYINGRDIWVATNSGIAKSNLDVINLLAPESWTNYTTSHGLPDNETHTLSALGPDIYAGTEQGVARFDGSHWQTINRGLGSVSVAALLQKNGELYVGTTRGIYQLEGDTRWTQLGDRLSDITSLDVDVRGDIWVGRKNRGFAHFSSNENSWENLMPPGPGGNTFTDLALDKDGVLWCASSGQGIFKFDGLSWQNFSKKTGLPNNDIQAVVVDSRNRKWFGSWGGGLILLDEEDNFHVFGTPYLSGIIGYPNYVVINGLAVDDNDNIWILNREAANGNALAVVTPDFQWAYFSTNEGLKSNLTTCIAIDPYGRKWVGTQKNGLSVVDDNGTILDKSDDDLTQGLTTDDGLPSNNIRDIAFDREGKAWIGTSLGLCYWDPREEKEKVKSQWGLLSDDITTVAVDIRNNKWFGTSAGISFMSSAGDMVHYTTDTSPLVNNNINAFAFDYTTGKAYFGTSNGLSWLETPYAATQPDLSMVKVYPNPLIIDENGGRLYIDKLAHNSSIRIFTANGLLVRTIPTEDPPLAQVTWDGKNDQGQPVATGIYIFLIYTKDGLTRVAKVAVIRK